MRHTASGVSDARAREHGSIRAHDARLPGCGLQRHADANRGPRGPGGRQPLPLRRVLALDRYAERRRSRRAERPSHAVDVCRSPGESGIRRERAPAQRRTAPVRAHVGQPRRSKARGQISIAPLRECSRRARTASTRSDAPSGAAHPIFAAFGLGPAFLASVLGGASIDLQDQSNLLHYLARERQFRPNVRVRDTFLLRDSRARPASPAAVRIHGHRGDRISRATFFRSEELHGPLINAYGCTEMGFIFSGDVDMPAELRFRTVGRPLPGVRFRIVEHPDSSDPAIGSLQIQYPHAFEGYVDLDGLAMRPETAFEQDWYCAADLVKHRARRHAGGYRKVRPERQSQRNAACVRRSRVRPSRGRRDRGGSVAAGANSIRGRKIVAFCALRSGSERSEAELRADLSSRVPPFAVPDRIRVVPQLPRLSNGKSTGDSWRRGRRWKTTRAELRQQSSMGDRRGERVSAVISSASQGLSDVDTILTALKTSSRGRAQCGRPARAYRRKFVARGPRHGFGRYDRAHFRCRGSI